MSVDLSPEQVAALFTRSDASYLCARWGRPLAPIVFGVEDQTLGVVKGAFEVICHLAGHRMTETDPELGVNLMIFFVTDWTVLLGVPDLGRMIDGLDALVERLIAAEANQYRVFRFDVTGAIRAAFVLLRMDDHLSAVPAETVALNQAVQTILLWSDTAFIKTSPLAQTDAGHVLLRPEIGAVIRAAYDPALPDVARDPSHALRLYARLPKPV